MKVLTTEEQYLHRLKKGGRGVGPALQAVLTPEGHNLYRCLTGTQKRVWRTMICGQLKHGSVAYRLRYKQSSRPIDTLCEWGGLEGSWDDSKTFRGQVPTNMVRDRVTPQPNDDPGRATNIAGTVTQPEVDASPTNGTAPDTLFEYDVTPPPEGMSAPLVATIGVASAMVGMAFGILLTLVLTP